VPSVPAARCGPGVGVAPRAAPVCTALPGFASPVGTAVAFALPRQPQAGAAEAGGAAGCCLQLACGVCWGPCPLPSAMRAARPSVSHSRAQAALSPSACRAGRWQKGSVLGPALGQRLCLHRVCVGHHGLGTSNLNCVIGRINANWYFGSCNSACVASFGQSPALGWRLPGGRAQALQGGGLARPPAPFASAAGAGSGLVLTCLAEALGAASVRRPRCDGCGTSCSR